MIKWLSSGSAPAAPSPAPEKSGPPGSAQSSLGLGALVQNLRDDRKYHILDLGPALGPNVEFFAQFNCRLYIEDLYNTLVAFDYFSPGGAEIDYPRVFEHLLPFRQETVFDFVLAWDLFNYLEREPFSQMVRHLRRFTRPGTLIFALISTLKHIQDRPHNFRIVDKDHLVYETTSPILRLCPRYQQTDLNQLMPGFRVSNSFLLRNGIKEYIFVRE